MAFVFISYARQDAAAAAARVRAALAAAGFDVWVDDGQILAGERYADTIERGLAAADVVVALLSPWSVRRAGELDALASYCLTEITHAQKTGKPVVPARVEPGRDLLELVDTHVLDLTGWPAGGGTGCCTTTRAGPTARSRWGRAGSRPPCWRPWPRACRASGRTPGRSPPPTLPATPWACSRRG